MKVLEQMATPYGKSYGRYVIEDLEKLAQIDCKHDHRHIDIPALMHIVLGVDPAYSGKDRMINKKLVFEQKTNEEGSFTCVCRMEDDDGKA